MVDVENRVEEGEWLEWTRNPSDLRYRASIYLLLSSAFAHEPTIDELRGLAQTGAGALAEEADAPVRDTTASAAASATTAPAAAVPAIDAPAADAEEESTGVPDEELAMTTLFGMLASIGPEVSEDDRRRVATEYAELFVGPRPPLAPLYESIYLGSPSRLFTAQTHKVRAFYERNGFDVSARGHVPDDHVAYELEFVANLMARLAGVLEGGTDAAPIPVGAPQDVTAELADFLNDHLGRWIGAFARRVSQSQAGDYYEVWARYAHAVVASDAFDFARAVATR